MSRVLRALATAALCLALVVVVVGAYVRLSDAGLGCPDWPFCYGKPLPAGIADGDALAKAWKEMGHRYLAGTLGMLLLGILVVSFAARRERAFAAALALLVLFQATLGKWTVTMLLKPAIVTGHLLGGMAIVSLLIVLLLRQASFAACPGASKLRASAAAALAVVAIQIVLGGWVSANYAALACPDLPGCLGQAVPPMDFGNAFHVVRELGRTNEGELLSREALTAIHWTHRMFALLVVAVVGFAAWRASRVEEFRALGALLALALAVQFGLGVSNVLLGLPLPLAAAHNAGAALLLGAAIVLNFFAFRALRPPW